jgi:NTE family protein
LDRLVIRPFIEAVSSRSLTRDLVLHLWRALGPRTNRTDVLANTFGRWFFEGRELESLSPACRFVFNAANLTTGVRFAFERDRLGDWVFGSVSTSGSGVRLAQAVAASAAVPGVFAPFTMRGVHFPCDGGRPAKLLDGGAYDNSGLEAVDDLRHALLIAVNAGGIFHTRAVYGRIPVIRDLDRAAALLYRQSTALRTRAMVDRFKAWEAAAKAGQPPPAWARRGVLFGLATRLDAAKIPQEWTKAAGRDEYRDRVRRLAEYKTSFGRFPNEVCQQLIHRGWWLTGMSLTKYHPGALGHPLPVWTNV